MYVCVFGLQNESMKYKYAKEKVSLEVPFELMKLLFLSEAKEMLSSFLFKRNWGSN